MLAAAGTFLQKVLYTRKFLMYNNAWTLLRIFIVILVFSFVYALNIIILNALIKIKIPEERIIGYTPGVEMIGLKTLSFIPLIIQAVLFTAYILCDKLIKTENLSVWGNAGKTSLACGLLILVFVVIPSYGKRVSVKHSEVDEYEERKEIKKRTSESIKNFLEKVYQEVSFVIVECSGKIVEIRQETEIRDFLNCFVCANYDKVYEEYVDRTEAYNIEFVLKNGDAISCTMNMDNVLFWYGGITRMDHASCKRAKNIIRSKGV